MKKNSIEENRIVRKLKDQVGQFEIECEVEEVCMENNVLRIRVDGVLKKDITFGSFCSAKNFAWGYIAGMEQLAKVLREIL